MEATTMFLDCPAWLDEDGALRCGLPAEVRYRYTLRSSDGPVEAAAIRCPSGHWFNGPIGSLTWERDHEHEAGSAAAIKYRPPLAGRLAVAGRPAFSLRGTRTALKPDQLPAERTGGGAARELNQGGTDD